LAGDYHFEQEATLEKPVRNHKEKQNKKKGFQAGLTTKEAAERWITLNTQRVDISFHWRGAPLVP